MRVRRREEFTTIKTEGAILPPDLLARVREGDGDLEGLRPEDYHLDKGEKLNERVSRSWNRLVGSWAAFQAQAEKVDEDDPGTTVTRERWLLPLFEELGFGRLQTSKAYDLNGKSYPISHEWGRAPIHLLGLNVPLDHRTPGVAGAARTSPHSLVQEFLNRSDDHLWAFLSNGFQLRILRDNASLTRQAYVEFDLDAMMDGEVYADFALLWLLCHQSRVEGDVPEEFWLELWSQAAQEQGTRALEQLRDGVEAAISVLGAGYLAHPANHALKERLREGDLEPQDYYRQLLRMVYRLIFLFVAEDRGLLFDPDAGEEAKAHYRDHYSTARLRTLAERRRGTRHPDLYRGLCSVMDKLGVDGGCPELGLPGLGGFLWSEDAIPDLIECQLANRDLLEIVRSLAFTEEDRTLRALDYKNLGPEELGSVYESLLELQPEMNVDAPTFELKVVGGSERKTTGSYYTPTSLIQCLLDSALDPVMDEALKADDPEEALLNLKICDPATGSGHFLVAAAHRMARRLASVRTGDEEPSPEAQRSALRDVISRCIYGVDINPMAVELCKVNLWLEALDPGKPLTFLDDKIQCGNSLLGTTPALLEEGIPDDAFKPLEGDDRSFVSSLKKQNKQERSGQMSFFADFESQGKLSYAILQREALELSNTADSTVSAVKEKGKRYQALLELDAFRHSKLLADAWCASFVWLKHPDAPEAITENAFRKLIKDPSIISPDVRKEIERLARQYQFFHWHLVFPGVFWLPAGEGPPENEVTGWSGGFDVVLGNPPWERVKLQEKEWFVGRNDEIANAPNKAARGRLINQLKQEDPNLYDAFLAAKRRAEGESHLLRNSNRYPLCGRGDINTYQVFAELKRSLIATTGRVGCIVPTGIATDDTTKFFFQDLMDKGSLSSLYDFENRKALFPGVHRSYKFCLLTLTGTERPVRAADFLFFALGVDDLRDEERHFSLSQKEITLFNPNTRTSPIFRSKRDTQLCRKLYRTVPVFIDESGEDIQSPWQGDIYRAFDLGNPKIVALAIPVGEMQGTQHSSDEFRMYEAKMFWQFDHRFSTYLISDAEYSRTPNTNPVDDEQKKDPSYVVTPRMFLQPTEVTKKLEAQGWNRPWLISYRNITNSTNERTCVGTILPYVATDYSVRLLLPHGVSAVESMVLIGVINSFVFDFTVRSSLQGTNLSDYIFKQLPIPTIDQITDTLTKLRGTEVLAWLSSLFLELIFTSSDLEKFAEAAGYNGPPFKWNETRRFMLRSELDAIFFHVYMPATLDGSWMIEDIKDNAGQDGTDEELDELEKHFPTPRHAVDYILDTFPIVRHKDEDQYGEYRTKRVILEIYDEMQQAIATGEPYQTRLDPPPADPRVAHMS